MNKNIHRLVFNAARGMLVAVQESAMGHAKGRQGNAERSGHGTAFVPVFWLTALAASMMGLPVLPDQSAHAQTLPIQVDKNMPGQRPVVGVAANGTPVVNIAPPQGNAGTSVNNFIQYNVGPSGVVLNNGGANSQTQIAGWVQGNPMLGPNHASNIVVQVTRPNPSQLLGQQEIAGNRANLILVNPAGLYCSGCGTINADRFTLSTGRPVFGADGNLTGFDVREGNISVGGQGLSSPQAQVDLLARSIHLNAELWVKHLNAVTGANQVNYQTLNATPQAGTGTTPQFALDASALGSMFTNAVRLVGTEKGLGFNLGGGITARAGDIVVENNGDVRVLPGGRLQAEASVTVAGTRIDNAGTITTRGGISATAPGQLTNRGTLAAGTDLLAQGDRIVNSGTIGAGVDANANVTGAGTANLTARTSIQSNGTIVTGTDSNLAAPTLDLSNGKVVSHHTANLAASGDITHQNARLEGNTVQVNAGGTVDNRGGAIVAGINGGNVNGTNVLNQNGAITSGGVLGIKASQTVDNTGGTMAGTNATTVAAAGVINRRGVIGSVQDKLLVTGTLDNTSGKALAATDLSVSGGAIVNDHGQLSAGDNLRADTGGLALVNTSGVIAAANIQADTGTLDNRAGVMQSKGLLVADTHGQAYDNSQGGLTVANGAITLNTGAFNNQGGAVSGQQAVTLTGTTLDNTSGFTHAGGLLDARAGTIVNRSTLGGTDAAPKGMEGATVRIQANAIDNIDGALRADTAMSVGAATLDNTRGEVTSGGTAQLNVRASTNTDGLLAANTRLGIAADSLTGDGTVQSKGDLGIKLTSDFTNTKTLAAVGKLDFDTSGDLANLGKMAADALNVHGRNITNDGELSGQASNTVRADQAALNRGLIDGGAVRVEAGTMVTNLDRIYGDSVAIGAGQQIVNDRNPATGNGAVIASRSGEVNLGAPDIVNREHALILSSRDLNVGGALDSDGKATGRANSLTNASATIDVARDASINAASITNQNNHFQTEVTDTGVVSRVTYRMKGSTDEIDPDTAILFDWKLGSTDYFHPATDLSWIYRDGNERGAPRWLVLPSDKYPFSTFGPPFDWSRRIDGTAGPVLYWGSHTENMQEGDNVLVPYTQWSPVGLAFARYTNTDNLGNVLAVTNERFYYKPDDAIWDKFGVAHPDSAPPPFQAPCANDAPAACGTAYLAYKTWHDTNFARYQALNDKIKAFNQDFHNRSVSDFYSVNEQTRTRDEAVRTTDPARILVGGNAALNGTVVNDKSEIAIGGSLTVPAPVDNRGYTGSRIETVTGTQDWNYVNYGVNNPDRRATIGTLPPIDLTLPLALATGLTQEQLGTVTGTGTVVAGKTGVGPITSAPTMTQVPLTPDGASSGGRLGGEVIRTVTPTLAVPGNALFQVHAEPGTRYLIETDPRFTNQRQWLSSDFMLTQLGQDPTLVLKRLGDGYYEARLVADAVMLGTGQRFVGDYTSNEAQYRALMQSGIAFGKQFSLNVGTALTTEQMAALTGDIVWLVEETVTLPDGSTHQVLVPQVYLKVREGDLKGDGTLITARNATIKTDGDVKNTGTIAARDVMLIDAGNIRNERGTLSAGTMGLNAKQDIDNLAGKINAGKLAATAGRDINLTTTTASASNTVGESAASRSVVSGVSSLEVDNAVLVAGRDINSKASSIAATGDLGMGAGRDINLGTVQVGERRDTVADPKNRTSVARRAETGTQISADNVTLAAGRDVNAKAAYMNANDALSVSAGRDINVKAGEASVSVRDEQSFESGGFLSKKSTHTIDARSQTEALGSTLSGDTVDMTAKRDLAVSGSTVAATHDVNLGAGNNLTIGTAETTSSAYSFKEEKKSGFGATGSGLSYGKREQKDTVNDNGTQQAGSLIGSTDGSVHMKAGSTLRVAGSDLIARQDITGVGADVTIEAAQNRQHHDETHEVKQSGFTLGVSGGAIGAALNAANKVDSASKSQDGRASALWGMAAGRDAYDAASALAGPGGATAGAAVTLSFGTSQSRQTFTQDSTSHDGSNVRAGSTTAFMATGVDANSNQTKGDLNIVGSNIDANKVALGAKHDIHIVSATDTEESHSTNKSSSASVGVSYGIGANNAGFSVSASASKSNGNSDSQGTTQANSHVTGRESVTFVSGSDTNILGATVNGGKVTGEVGGNLNIASRQDTEEMRARQESMGGGISISQGGGTASVSASKGKASGSYANVSEQSGIYAGQEGFDITVKGNTDLKGAVIGSLAGKDKNHLDTGTLTFSDIKSHSDYSATSMGFSGGGAMGSPVGQSNSGQTSGKNTGSINPMIPQHESGSQDGVAHSAIADGTITIRDRANQKQDLADLKRDTAGSNSTVGRNPDLKNVLDKQADMMAAAQAAGEAVAKTVGNVAAARQRDAQGRYDTAAQVYQQDPSAENQAAMAVAQSDVDGWKEGGAYRAALHMAGGALVAGLGGGSALAGAAGAGAASLASGIGSDIRDGVKGSVSTGSSNLDETIGNLAANIVAGGIGAVVGGGSGAATASNVDRFNRQLHPDEAKFIKEKAVTYAAQKGISVDQAEAELTQQALRQTDDVWATRYAENADARKFLGDQTGKQGNGFAYFDGKADGSYTNNVKYAGSVANNSTERALYDKAWKNSQAGQNGKIAGSALALGDALKDPAHYAANPQDLKDAAVGLAQQRDAAIKNRDLGTVAYIDDKLSMLRMVAQDGKYDARTMTNEERVAFGFAAEGAGAGAGKAVAQLSAKVSEVVAGAVARQQDTAASRQREIELNSRRDDADVFAEYKNSNGSWKWPDNEGAVPGTTTRGELQPGATIDRFGSPRGSYVAPERTPTTERALAPGSATEAPHVYEVTRPLPAARSIVAPAFGQEGYGVQYKLDKPVQWYLENGYLREKK
ncbi:adhesin [Cupriavidus necator]|uniref:Adhesin n=1 Tax=Cupriavidus necator TaxID=106590 RepID=A0A2P1DV17_CUPNE|nr:hemagglutinin repeat-containing protein [Cupriavidus necator]AVK72241.1 adhesin [Cupriavidus necator]